MSAVSEQSELSELARTAMAALPTDHSAQVEVVVMIYRSGVCRFAGSRIVPSSDTDVLRSRVRVVLPDGRQGVRTTTGTDGLADLIDGARTAARLAIADPNHAGLPHDQHGPPTGNSWVDTPALTPAARAHAVHEIINRGAAAGAAMSGSVRTDEWQLCLVNTLGVRQVGSTRAIAASVAAELDANTGFAADIRPDELAGLVGPLVEEALWCARACSGRKTTVDLGGSNRVLFAPNAANTLVQIYTSWCDGAAYHNGSSPLRERLGDEIAAPTVSLVDDAYAADAIGLPFDFEGVTKQPVTLVDGGRMVGLVYEWGAAHRLGAHPTGHGLAAPNPSGAQATNARLRPGTLDDQQLLAELGDGIMIARLHYPNLLDLSGRITAVSRDGTFLVRGGEIVARLPNVRISDSLPQLFANVVAIGQAECGMATCGVGASRSPAIVVEGIAISE